MLAVLAAAPLGVLSPADKLAQLLRRHAADAHLEFAPVEGARGERR